MTGPGYRTYSIDASRIVSGTLDAARLPAHSAALITSGTLDAARIPALDASKIGSGTLAAARLPAATTAAIGAVLKMPAQADKAYTGSLGTEQAQYADPASLYNQTGEANFRATVAADFARLRAALRTAGILTA